MKILPINQKLKEKIKRFNLEKKINKQLRLLENNPKHPGLNVELLEPKEYGVYSFRIDRKFRGLFIYRQDLKSLEIINITLHYQ